MFQKRINEGELQGSKKFKELVENATKVWEDSQKEEDNEDIREVVKEVRKVLIKCWRLSFRSF